MASKSADIPCSSSTRTSPIPVTVSPFHLNFRDTVRIMIYFLIPIYSRVFLFSSFAVFISHVYIVATTGFCIAHLSRGLISLNSVWDIIYGLLISVYPQWSTSLLKIMWLGPEIGIWRWEVGYWTFVAIQLVYLLPENFGTDVQKFIQEYQVVNPDPIGGAGIIAGAIVYLVLWPKGCPWYDVYHMWRNIAIFLEHTYFAFLNYAHLKNYGKTLRQDIGPLKDTFGEKWAFDTRGNLIRLGYTFEERL